MENLNFLKNLDFEIQKIFSEEEKKIKKKNYKNIIEDYLKFISLYFSIEPFLDFLEISYYYDLFIFYFYKIEIKKNKNEKILKIILKYFITIFSYDKSEIEDLINKKFIDKLVKILNFENIELIKYVLTIFQNITYLEGIKFCEIFLKTDLIFFLSNFLKSENCILIEYVIDLIMNLVLENSKIRNFILEKQIFFFELLLILQNENFTNLLPILNFFRNLFNIINIKTAQFLYENIIIFKTILNLLNKNIMTKAAMKIHHIFKQCLLLGDCLKNNNYFEVNFIIDVVKGDDKLCDKLWEIQKHDEGCVYEVFKDTIDEYNF